MKRERIEPKDRIVYPIDLADPAKAKVHLDRLYDKVGVIKFGLEYIHGMPLNLLPVPRERAIANLDLYREIFERTHTREFKDAKLDDIPNTVGKAADAISALGVKMFNVHASAGRKAIRAAVEVCRDSMVLGVTVLTSIDEEECWSIFGETPSEKVLQFATWLLEEGAHGIICSPQEAELIRQHKKFDVLKIVCPGIRPAWAPANDQKRVLTPREAILAGVDYLVIGRPISGRFLEPLPEVPTPEVAVARIVEEIAEAEKEVA